MNQSGSVWNRNKISLDQPFDFWFNVFLGCGDNPGADGIVFILQPISTSVGTTGEGMGFDGVAPSIGIPLDTYQNINRLDPSYDHISIQSNGYISHDKDLAGPVSISPTSFNVEDCQWHKLRVTWDPATQWLRAYFDESLRVEVQINLVGTIFNGDPNVYWGFTGGTGGQVNLQQFCTALDPIYTTDITNNVACPGKTINFSNTSESFAPIIGYHWDFGDGSNSDAMIPPPHNYVNEGEYKVSLQIKGLDGCENDTFHIITVGSIPNAQFSVSDTCFGFAPVIKPLTAGYGLAYEWRVDGSLASVMEKPSFANLASGPHLIQMTASSVSNCGPPSTASQTVFIKPLPEVDALVTDGCTNSPVLFTGRQLDTKTTIARWNWTVSDNTGLLGQNQSHTFAKPGEYAYQLSAEATNGCQSQKFASTLFINEAIALAGNDTAVIMDKPFQLSGNGNGSFDWFPASGLSDPHIKDPVTVLSADRQYVLTVRTAEGCQAKDSILIKVYKGPYVYVPNAFTPNGDGKNDWLKPVYVGIRKLDFFRIFNRWGNLVFSTEDMGRGWNGMEKGKTLANETYIYAIQVTDNTDRKVLYKGSLTILK
jgi:gliding motility-associated-like protein